MEHHSSPRRALDRRQQSVVVYKMGDVADILGFSGASTASGRASPALGGPLGPLQENKRTKGASSAVASSKKGKPQGVSREVYALLGSEGLPPEVCSEFYHPVMPYFH